MRIKPPFKKLVTFLSQKEYLPEDKAVQPTAQFQTRQVLQSPKSNKYRVNRTSSNIYFGLYMNAG